MKKFECNIKYFTTILDEIYLKVDYRDTELFVFEVANIANEIDIPGYANNQKTIV